MKFSGNLKQFTPAPGSLLYEGALVWRQISSLNEESCNVEP